MVFLILFVFVKNIFICTVGWVNFSEFEITVWELQKVTQKLN